MNFRDLIDRLLRAGLPMLLLLLSGCHLAIHQYPETTASIPTLLTVHQEKSPLVLYKEVLYDDAWTRSERLLPSNPVTQYTPADSLAYRRRMEFYRGPVGQEGELLGRQTDYFDISDRHAGDTVRLQLTPGTYHVLSWMDYVSLTDPADKAYDTHALTEVTSLVANYPADTNLRGASAGTLEFEVDGISGFDADLGAQLFDLPLDSPLGQYQLIPTDAEAYAKLGGRLEQVSVRIVYKMYVAVSYDVEIDEKTQFLLSYSFYLPSVRDAGVADERQPLFGDNLFTNADGSETVVICDLYLYDAGGKLINTCPDLRIPLCRHGRTLVRGPFLTHKFNNSGGMSLDEMFEGEFVIKV